MRYVSREREKRRERKRGLMISWERLGVAAAVRYTYCTGVRYGALLRYAGVPPKGSHNGRPVSEADRRIEWSERRLLSQKEAEVEESTYLSRIVGTVVFCGVCEPILGPQKGSCPSSYHSGLAGSCII
ncbi:hypothetical protein J6590_038243 [Homalodisca vitripennis]|nr:hypothetical protein J6590_038243 [Homalodisca vitripennis]